MTTYAELEIGLHRVHADAYQVELRYANPDSEAELAPQRGEARIDREALLALQEDPQAYGETLTKLLSRLFGRGANTGRNGSMPPACPSPSYTSPGWRLPIVRFNPAGLSRGSFGFPLRQGRDSLSRRAGLGLCARWAAPG